MATQVPAATTRLEPPPASQRRRGVGVPGWLIPILAIASVLLLWELLTRTELLPSRYLPPMTATFSELSTVVVTAEFWTSVGYTMQGWALGLGIAVALAIPLGIVIGSSQMLYRSTRVLVEFLRPIPSVALIPLAVLIYGTGLESKVFLAAFAAFWPVLIQTLYGVQDVDPVATDTAHAYGMGRFERLYRIKLPSAVPYIATGVRISSAVALILAVTAELVIGSPGLGQDINIAQSGGALELMYGLIIVTGLLGWALNVITTRGEKRLLHWHPSHRAAVT